MVEIFLEHSTLVETAAETWAEFFFWTLQMVTAISLFWLTYGSQHKLHQSILSQPGASLADGFTELAIALNHLLHLFLIDS